MWVLEAISEVPFKKPFLIFISTLGAAFLLLAYFFVVNPLYHPLIYTLVALDAYLVWHRNSTLLRALILVPGAYLLTYFLHPNYQFVFAICLSLLIGKLVFPESFRPWKWLASSLLLYLGILITSVWQQMGFLNQAIPFQLSPIVHAAVFSFLAQCSLLAFSLQKDRVLVAVEHYPWKTPSESATMAVQTSELYQKVKEQLRRREKDVKIREDLAEFTEKIIHLCHRLQEVSRELSNTNASALDQQIAQLKEKAGTVTDELTKQQYEQTLTNKEKQKEQYEALRLQGERMRAQILNYISALENMRFAYTNQEFSSASDGAESIEFFLNMAKTRADNAYETSEAYQKLRV